MDVKPVVNDHQLDVAKTKDNVEFPHDNVFEETSCLENAKTSGDNKPTHSVEASRNGCLRSNDSVGDTDAHSPKSAQPNLKCDIFKVPVSIRKPKSTVTNIELAKPKKEFCKSKSSTKKVQPSTDTVTESEPDNVAGVETATGSEGEGDSDSVRDRSVHRGNSSHDAHDDNTPSVCDAEQNTRYDSYPTEKNMSKSKEKQIEMPELSLEKKESEKVLNKDGDMCVHPSLAAAQLAQCYKEPKWASLTHQPYSFEVLKGGTIINIVDLSSRSFHVIGRLPACNIVMEHPSLSRYHAVVQYCGTSTEQHAIGWYLYDLASTHGTWINKRKVKARTYYRLCVGYVVKFGGSTRLHILQGPESDVETESKLTVTELKDLQEQQKKAKESAKLLAAVEDAENVVKESEDDSCAWGISSNDADVYEGENPFSLLEPQNEELYVVDPKKALKGFFEREGLELPEYEITDVGKGNFRCIVELPLMGASGEPLKADVTQDGKKREVVVACALAACRILDMHGELRKATHASRKKKRKNWEDADFYDSDDDTFLDRTGDIEKKRRQRKSRIQKDTEKAASYDSLVTKMDEVKRKMTVIEDQLRKAKHEAEALEAEGLDALDAFMSLIRAGGMDSKTKMLLKKELSELRREEYGLERMLKAACPALPTLDVSLMRPSQRPTLPLTGRMKGPKRHLPAQANAAADKPLKEPVGKQESNDEESDLEEGVEMRDDEPVKEEAASRTSPTVGPGTGADEEGGKGGRNDDGVIGGEGAIDEDVTKDDKGAKDMDATKDDQGTKDIEGRKDDKIDKDEEGTAKDEDSVSGATVEDDTKDEETSNDGGTARLVGPVVSERTSDAGPQLMTRGPVPDGELVHSQHTTQGKDKTTEGKRKSGPSVSQASKKLKKITVSKEYCKNDPAYALWCPPQDQAGDGRTSLNDKYGY